MAETTGIAWAHSTFNPWIGCTKVSPGCDHCYAEVSRPAQAYGIKWGAGQPRYRTKDWAKPRSWDRKAFHGRPIIAYSIMAAQDSGLFTHGVYVTTDDHDIANIAWHYGAHVHNRSAALARNEVGTQAVMAAVLQEIFSHQPDRPEIACCIYATAPMMTKGDLRRGFAQFASGISAYAYSTGPDGKDAGQFYWGMSENFIMGLPLDGHSQHVVLPEERVCDINTIDDWIRAERMYEALRHEEEA